MKTDKEYPATHSMATSWFAIDKDGNVAIMEYEDNGPVPIGVPESSEEEIIIENFAIDNPGEQFVRWCFSDEDIERFMKTANDYEWKDDEDSLYNAVVKVDMTRFEDFLKDASVFSRSNTVCMNMEKGLFFLDWFGYEKKQVQAVLHAVSSGIVTPLKQLNFDNWDEDHDDALRAYPFFVYRQSYDSKELIERTVVPEKPFKYYRLPYTAQRDAIRLPFSFADTPEFQTAQYEFSNASWFEDELINNRMYHCMPIGGGKEAHLAISSMFNAGCGIKCRRCYQDGSRYHDTYEHQGCKFPTVAVIKDMRELESPDTVRRNFIGRSSVFLPILQGLPSKCGYIMTKEEREFSENSIDWMFSHCHEYLEKNINFFLPHVILIYKNTLRYLEKYYLFENGKIRISRRKYPYYLWEELEEHRPEIEALAKLPYRGGTIPFVIPVEDVDEPEITIIKHPW